MQHVDALSRSVGYVYEMPLEKELEFRQVADPVIRQISTELELRESDRFKLIDGLVYKKVDDNYKFYVPESMVPAVLRAHHDGLAHVGVEKTLRGISQNYWFPAMRKKIFEYISNCFTCVMSNEATNKKERETSLYPPPKGPMEILHVDHFGPLSETSNRYRHILVVVDAFTRFTWLAATKSTTTAEVIRHLETIFYTFGKPSQIVSDRGTAYTSKEFSEFVKVHSIEHRLVAVAAPWANGMVERVNRFLKNTMIKLLTSPSEWKAKLGIMQYVVNNTYHSSIKTTPAKLMLGIDRRCHEDALFVRFTESLQGVDTDLELTRNQARD